MYGGADADSARDEMNSSQRAACPSHSGSRGVFDLTLRKVCPSFHPHDLSPSFNFPFQIERDKGGQRRHGPKSSWDRYLSPDQKTTSGWFGPRANFAGLFIFGRNLVDFCRVLRLQGDVSEVAFCFATLFGFLGRQGETREA